MIKAAFFALFIGSFINNLFAQSSDLHTNNIWGESACGLQISIAVSNNIIAVGSNFDMTISLKNSSTNIIATGESRPEADFKVLLTDESGKVYQLTPNVIFYTRLLRMNLKPGEIRSWFLRVGVNKYYEPPGINPTFENIPSGKYTLKATRKFIPCNIESNLLQVRIE